MSSREVRRAQRKRAERDSAEKKDTGRRPLLYGISIVVLVLITASFIGGPLLQRSMQTPGGSFLAPTTVAMLRPWRATTWRQPIERRDSIRNSQQGGNLESQLYQAWRSAFNQTVFHVAVLAEMERSGAWVSDDGVNDSLVEYGPYVVGGVFSQDRYRATPQAEKDANRRLRREELLHDLYLQDLFATSKMSAVEKDFLTEMAAEESRFAIVAFSFDELPDSTVLDYGLANRTQFRRRQLSRITITSNEREASQIRERAITGGTSFGELARSYSKGFYADKGGDMGWQNYYDLRIFFDTEEPVEGVFALEEGEISPIYQSGSSWVFFRADSAVIEPDFSDTETLAAVRDYILTDEIGVAEEYFIGTAEEFAQAARSDGFAPAAAQFGLLPTLETDFAPLNYGRVFPLRPLRAANDEQGTLAGASFDEELFEALYSLQEGEVTSPVLLGDRILVAALVGRRPMPEDDLDTTRSLIDRSALQILQDDLPEFLIDDDKLVDEFQDVFFSQILGTS